MKKTVRYNIKKILLEDSRGQAGYDQMHTQQGIHDAFPQEANQIWKKHLTFINI